MGDRVHDPARWSFLIPAAGSGDRLGGRPKCLLTLGGETLWQRAVRQARAVATEVILAIPDDCLAQIRGTDPSCRVIAGGATRQDTVALLLAAASGERILIHDVARPFASRHLMLAVADLAERSGAAGCLAPCDGPVVSAPGLDLAQMAISAGAGVAVSPLAFHRTVLEEAYRRARDAGLAASSTVELVWRCGHPVRFVPSERDNLKITFPGDLRLAEAIAAAWEAEDD